MRCCNCNGAAHPATGNRLSLNMIQCHRCAGYFHAWVIRHTAMKKRIVKGVGRGTQAFYVHAGTSIIAK